MNQKNKKNRIDEIERGKSGYTFHSIKKSTIKMFRYHDIRAFMLCKLSKSTCSSGSIVNIQNDDNYCFSWCISSHENKVDNHRERV